MGRKASRNASADTKQAGEVTTAVASPRADFVGLPLAKRVKKTLTVRDATLKDHADTLTSDTAAPVVYAKEVMDMVRGGVEMTSATKARAAAFCWKTGQVDTTDALLVDMKVSEILSVVKMLDCKRQVNALDKKLAKVKRAAKRKELNAARRQLEVDMIPMDGPSATKALMKRVKAWAKKIPAEKLEFYLLNFSTDPWKQLADLAHLHPRDFQLDYFLPVVFGESPPEGTIHYAMAQCKDAGDLPRILKEYPVLSTCFSFLRNQYGSNMTPEVKKVLLSTIPLEEVVWWFEDLDCAGADDIVKARLEAGEGFTDNTGRDRANFGKLMERLLLFRKRSFGKLLVPYAQKLLSELVIRTNKKVAVFGDASASMQVAVNSATIIGSVLCSCLDASLSFFDNKCYEGPCVPRSVEDVLLVTDRVRAKNATAPAACLWPFLDKKVAVDLFIVVTDEEENTSYDGKWSRQKENMFVGLFERYVKEVNPAATVFFVSFLASTTTNGQMVQDFNHAGLGEKCKQFRFDPRRPDLSKLNALIAEIAEDTQVGEEEAIDLKDLKVPVSEELKLTAAAAPVREGGPSGRAVAIKCRDTIVNVTEEQAATITAVFSDPEKISAAVLLEALPALRAPVSSSSGQSSRSMTSWVDVTSVNSDVH